MSQKPKLFRKFLALLLSLALFVYLPGGFGIAKTLDEINKEISDTAKAKQEAEQQKKSIAEQLTDTEKRLHDLEKDIAVLQDQLTVVEQSRAEAEIDLVRIQAELALAEAKMDEQGKIIDTRMVGIYKQGDTGYVDVLFGASSFSDFISRMTYLTMIVKGDKQTLSDFQIIKAQVEEDRELADAKKQDMISRENAIREIKAPLDTKKQEIDIEKNNKELLFAQLIDDIASRDQLLAELQVEQQEAAGRSVGGGDRPSAKGFIWPAYGEISSEFGYRVHPIWGDIRFHYGIDIAVDYVPLVAPAAGTVISAYWNEAVGNVLEVDHGGGIKTYYCHLQTGSYLVGVGDVVAQGQQMATTGNTGYSTTGAHLHFEVFDYVLSNDDPIGPYYTYKRGYRVNPLEWLQ